MKAVISIVVWEGKKNSRYEFETQLVAKPSVGDAVDLTEELANEGHEWEDLVIVDSVTVYKDSIFVSIKPITIST